MYKGTKLFLQKWKMLFGLGSWEGNMKSLLLRIVAVNSDCPWRHRSYVPELTRPELNPEEDSLCLSHSYFLMDNLNCAD